MTGGIARRPRVARMPQEVGVDPDEPEPGLDQEPEDELAAEPEEPQESEEAEEERFDEPAPVDEEPMPVIRLPPDPEDLAYVDDLPDPEDLAYFDEDDATPGPIGDQTRRADD
jgi:hypothetical protein